MIRFGDVTIDRATNTIWHGARYRRWWTPNYSDGRQALVAFRLLSHLLLISEAQNTDQLFDAVYGHKDDGGPLYGPKIITVLLDHLKDDLEKLNLELRTSRHNSRTLYKVVTK